MTFNKYDVSCKKDHSREVKFSVIIPLYNGASTIEATLDSVIGQTYKDFEIILVNDESPDNVGEIVKKYIIKHPDICFIYIEQPNKGLGGARNTAIRNATGEICSFIDQDDVWYPTKLEIVLKIFEKFTHVSIVCHNSYIRKGGDIVDYCEIVSQNSPLHRDLLFGGNLLGVSATSVKRCVIEDVDFFSEDIQNLHFIEDYDLWMRIALKGYKFYFISDFLSEYILHGANYSTGSAKKLEFMCRGELFVDKKHYQLRVDKLPLDWYRSRIRKANILISYAYKFIPYTRIPVKSVLYFAKAISYDPFLFLRIPIKILRVICRKIIIKRRMKR